MLLGEIIGYTSDSNIRIILGNTVLYDSTRSPDMPPDVLMYHIVSFEATTVRRGGKTIAVIEFTVTNN